MRLEMPVVWDERCRLHEAGGEIWVGVRTAGTETPARADAILAALAEAGARIVPAREHGGDAVLAVHDAALVDYLATAWAQWTEAGLPVEPGQDRVVPYVFPHTALLAGRAPALPAAPWAKPGYFVYDTMTL